VSVRNAAEAREAIGGGADVIDVKEPLAGSLGRAGLAATLDIAAAIQHATGRVPWTIACGELAEAGADDVVAFVASLVGRLPEGATPPWLLKVGLAGSSSADWERQLAGIEPRLPGAVAQACVVYADWRRCGAPAPERVVRLAGSLAGRTVLVDTFDKRQGGVFDAAPAGDLEAIVGLARSLGLAVALAGRIGLADAARVAAIAPDIVAVRSAVCGGDRLRPVESSLVDAARQTFCSGSPGPEYHGAISETLP
jgi:uncharacterized protein (UPF0264 family)